METNEHNQIMITLSRHTDMLQRIDGRLDTLNGKVVKHEDRLNSVDLRNAAIDGEKKGSRTVIMVLWVVASSVGVTLVSHLWK